MTKTKVEILLPKELIDKETKNEIDSLNRKLQAREKKIERLERKNEKLIEKMNKIEALYKAAQSFLITVKNEFPEYYEEYDDL